MREVWTPLCICGGQRTFLGDGVSFHRGLWGLNPSLLSHIAGPSLYVWLSYLHLSGAGITGLHHWTNLQDAGDEGGTLCVHSCYFAHLATAPTQLTPSFSLLTVVIKTIGLFFIQLFPPMNFPSSSSFFFFVVAPKPLTVSLVWSVLSSFFVLTISLYKLCGLRKIRWRKLLLEGHLGL